MIMLLNVPFSCCGMQHFSLVTIASVITNMINTVPQSTVTCHVVETPIRTAEGMMLTESIGFTVGEEPFLYAICICCKEGVPDS